MKLIEHPKAIFAVAVVLSLLATIAICTPQNKYKGIERIESADTSYTAVGPDGVERLYNVYKYREK